MAQRQVAPVLLVTVAAALCGGCGTAPAANPDPGPARRPVGRSWTAPPGWRMTATGQRCGPAADPAPVEPDVADVCLVTVTATNGSDRAQPIAGTDARPGPLWRVVGYDADGHEFHGHGRPEPVTPAGTTTTTEVVFEVPAGRRLQRVLLGDTIVRL